MNINKNDGFTFVEMIISVALLGVIALLITSILLNIMRAILKAESIKEIKQTGDFALTVMAQRLRNAKAVTTCTSGMSTIEITNKDGTLTNFYVNEDPPGSGVRKIVSDTNGSLEVLTASNKATIDISNDLMFDCDSASGRIHISYLLRYVSGANKPFEEQAAIGFDTTVVRRSL